MRRLLVFAMTVILVAGARPSLAQMSVVSGTVVRDTVGRPLGASEVTMPGLNRTARTNYLGEFRLDGIPPGRHAIIVRHVGFVPLIDSITVGPNQHFDAEFLMLEQPVVLDSQRVVAASTPVEPHLREFEERRKLGFGHFFDTAELRKIENGRSLGDYLASRLPGMKYYRPDPNTRRTDYYLGSGRTGKLCPVAMYIDGVALFVPGRNTEPPDISRFTADDYSAIEYYASGSTLPPQFNMTGSDCGVLLLWRRYK